MEPACPNCQRQLRPGMNFCPGCGTPVGGGPGPGPSRGPGTGAMPVSGRDGTIHFHVPTQGPYPMPYFGGPMMYPPPMSSKRAGAIASAVIMLISAIFVMIAGIFYTVEGLWWEDFWVALGVFCFFSFSMAVVATIAIARRTWRLAPLVADGLLISCGAFSMVDLDVLGIIIMVLAILALILIAVSFGQFNEGLGYQYPQPYMMPPPGAGMPGPQMGMPPPAGMGAPPPVRYPPPSGGAPPPTARPMEDGEDLIVDAYVGEGR